MKIALSGAGGFVASALKEAFPDYTVLERGDDHDALIQKLKGVEVVINLAGAPIIRRWSDSYKQTLVASRIETTKKLVRAVNASSVTHFISTSAVGIYPNNRSCDEGCNEHADDFLGRLCEEWEREAKSCEKKTTILRFGVVLGQGGGALAQMIPPFSLGVGGVIGDGKMITSWIHIKDLVNIYRFVIEKHLDGVFNATSPHPVTNRVLTKTLGKQLHRPTILPLPLFALKLMYGEAASVLSDSKEVYPNALLKAGFRFDYPDIDTALEDIIED